MFSPIKVVMKMDLGSVKSKLSSLDGENFSGDVLHLLSGRRETSNVLIYQKSEAIQKVAHLETVLLYCMYLTLLTRWSLTSSRREFPE